MKRRYFLQIISLAATAVPAYAFAKPLFPNLFQQKKSPYAAPVHESAQTLHQVWDNTARFEYLPAHEIEWISEFSPD